MKLADLQHVGYHPLRHHEKIDDDVRNVTYACRFVEQDEDTADVEVKDFGDIQFAHFWEKITGKRQAGSWSFATPAFWTTGGVVPILSRSLDADERYTPPILDNRFPSIYSPNPLPAKAGGGNKQIRSVVDRPHFSKMPGIVLAGSEEKSEELLFFPTFGELVAHHRGNKTPQYSSIVYDIKDDELDHSYKAGFHSAFWVKRLKFINSLAWNLTASPGDLSGFGLYVAPGDGQAPANTARRSTVLKNPGPVNNPDLLAYASWKGGGPFHPGHFQDQHLLDISRDGETLNPGHLDYRYLIYANRTQDGPLDINLGKWPDVKDRGNLYQRVHCRFDPDPLHTIPGGFRQGKGKFSWYTKSQFTFLIPPDLPTGKPPKKKPVPDIGFPGGGGGGGGGGAPVPIPKPTPSPNEKPFDPSKLPDVQEIPIDPNALPFPAGPELPPFAPGGALGGSAGFDVDDALKKFVNNGKNFPILASPNKMAIPGLLLRPDSARDPRKAIRYNPDPSPDQIDEWRERPGTVQIEAFAKEDASGNFKKNRDTISDRYAFPSAPGGLCVFPPEIGMDGHGRDWGNPNFTQSTTYFNLFREKVVLSWGTPDPTTGLVKDGWKMYSDSIGDLQMRGLDGSGDPKESSFFLMRSHVAVYGSTPPDLHIWNNQSDADEDSGNLILRGKAGGATAAYQLRMESETDSVAKLQIRNAAGTQLGVWAADGSYTNEGGNYTSKSIAAPGTPASGYGSLYAKSSDKKLYWKDDAGVEYDLTNSTAGDVVGPGSSTDNAIVRFDSTTGKLLQDSGVTVSDLASGFYNIDANASDLNLTGTNEVVINDASEQVDFRVESDVYTHLFSSDAQNHRLGFGIHSAGPDYTFHFREDTVGAWPSTVGAGLVLDADQNSTNYSLGSGISWVTNNDNPTIHKAIIVPIHTGGGTELHFSVSNSYGVGIQTAPMILSAANSGTLYVGATAATSSSKLECEKSAASVAGFNRTTSDGTIITLMQAGTAEGTISVSGTTVSYNSFLGAHDTQFKAAQAIPRRGCIVVSTGEAIPNHKQKPGFETEDKYMRVRPSSGRGQKNVYGVFLGKRADDNELARWGKKSAPVYSVAGLGQFMVRVTNTGGDIENGDYIQSSPRPGEGEKQPEAQLMNKTVAKSLVDVEWNSIAIDPDVGYKWRLIPCTIHCG